MNPYANLQPNNLGQQVTQAFQHGQQQAQHRSQRNALTAYAMNPDDPKAFEGLAQANPEMAIQARQQQAQAQLKGLEAHREKILMGAKIVRQIQPKDEAGWQQVRAMAQQVGIDLSDVPPNFDPQYVQGLIAVADAFEPAKQQQDRFIPLQPGGSLARVGPDGQPQIVFQPNDGSQQLGAPVQQAQGAPPPGHIEDGYRFRGGNPADPNAWEPVNGGPTPQASGGFPGY